MTQDDEYNDEKLIALKIGNNKIINIGLSDKLICKPINIINGTLFLITNCTHDSVTPSVVQS